MGYMDNCNKRFRGANVFDEGMSGGTNRQYKDRLFKALFGSPDRRHLTLELYNAMNGSSYTNPAEIQLTTIDDVVYMGMKNDVSFLFDQIMNLWEQQSTPNPNMPFRFLLYYAHVMERYVNGLGPKYGGIYSSALVQLPTPRMVLFYNGPGEMPEHLYLSNAYEDDTDPDVEVRVRVMNLNSGRSEILEQCSSLQDYVTFVESFRRYREQNDVDDRTAVSRAITDLRAGEVHDYLIEHKSEVIDMLLTEYDEEKTLKAEYYAGERAEQERSLRMLYDLVAEEELSIAAAVKKAAAYGVADETEFRRRATAQGIHLPD